MDHDVAARTGHHHSRPPRDWDHLPMNERAVQILGPDGQPAIQRKSALPMPSRPLALAGGRGPFRGPPYDAADVYGQHMSQWLPALGSADSELNPYRDRIVARV